MKIKVPKEAADFIRAASKMTTMDGNTKYILHEAFYEDENGIMYYEQADIIEVAERLYAEANPDSPRMDVPSYAYEQVEYANRRRIAAMSELSLYDWCKLELAKNDTTYGFPK